MYGCNNVEAGLVRFTARVSRILQLIKHIQTFMLWTVCGKVFEFTTSAPWCFPPVAATPTTLFGRWRQRRGFWVTSVLLLVLAAYCTTRLVLRDCARGVDAMVTLSGVQTFAGPVLLPHHSGSGWTSNIWSK